MTLAVTDSRPGAPTGTLDVTDIGAVPAPGPKQIQVKVAAFSIHPGDLLGIASRQTHGTPVVAGVEATGVVTATGPGVTSYTRPPQRVGGRTGFSWIVSRGRREACSRARLPPYSTEFRWERTDSLATQWLRPRHRRLR
jgi:NADPH:quinone reductase-like Zn-dependent oxidoreductase